MTWKQKLVKTLNRMGYDLRRYRPDFHPLARQMQQMEHYGIDLVLDVGANAGQFGEELRETGYTGTIHSFEPLEDAYAGLNATASRYRNWSIHNCALGSEKGRSIIHVAANSCSSSLLNMLPAHEEAAPYAKYIRDQEILVEALDDLLPEIMPFRKSVWLKVDTQGFENQVISGAQKSLGQIDTVQMEISLTPLYEGALGMEEMISMMRAYGYDVVDVEPEFCDLATGRLLQVNITFHRH